MQVHSHEINTGLFLGRVHQDVWYLNQILLTEKDVANDLSFASTASRLSKSCLCYATSLDLLWALRQLIPHLIFVLRWTVPTTRNCLRSRSRTTFKKTVHVMFKKLTRFTARQFYTKSRPQLRQRHSLRSRLTRNRRYPLNMYLKNSDLLWLTFHQSTGGKRLGLTLKVRCKKHLKKLIKTLI